MDKLPLVSVPVITYNSSEYIIDGLESIKVQTYKNIELIISDDCSTDNTIAICRKWIDENKHYFKRAVIVTTDKNTGVAGNLNRAIKECQGVWIKTLSGDDKFLPYTIERYVDYIKSNPKTDIVFGKLAFYGDDENLVKQCKDYYENKLYPKIGLTHKKQMKENLKTLLVPGPGLFYRKSLWSEIGGYDEKYQFCEEDPFMFKVYKARRKVFLLNEEVYQYYVRKDSLGRSKTNEISRHLKDRIRFFRDTRRKEMIKRGLVFQAIDESLTYRIKESACNGNLLECSLLKILRYFSPLRYVIKFKKIVNTLNKK